MGNDLYPEMVHSNRTQQVAEVLFELITSNKLVPGEFLPSESELCQRFGVSRPTLRQALRSLEARGLLTTKHGIGVVVANRTREAATDSLRLMLQRSEAGQRELLEVRWALECQAAKLAAQRATADDLRALDDAVGVMQNLASSVDDYIAADLRFHLCLGVASGNTVLVVLTDTISELLRETISATYAIDGRTEQRLHDHQLIVEAVRARQPRQAESAMRKHLLQTEQNLQRLGLL